jgi:site-specific DNA recombinase
MVFEWVAHEGLTLRKVVRRLHELGIAPRKSKRGVWSTSTLSTLLSHKAYTGKPTGAVHMLSCLTTLSARRDTAE